MNISLSKHSNSSSEIYITSRFLYLKHSLGALSYGGVGSYYCEYTRRIEELILSATRSMEQQQGREVERRGVAR
jgi:hypothetical protein